MKQCPKCGAALNDEAVFCTNCGTACGTPAGQQPAYEPPYQPPVMPYDHTAEFDPKDVSENKLLCMVAYLLGKIGIIIAMLSRTSSPYAAFHIRQAMKFAVAETLVTIVGVVLCFTLIIPIAAAIAYLVLLVIRIICFFQVCLNQAKEPVIIRSIPIWK